MRVAILDDIHGAYAATEGVRRLRERAEVTILERPFGAPEALRGFDALVANRERTKFTRALFEALPDLRILAQTGNHAYHVDFAAAADRGVVVAKASGGFSTGAAELAIDVTGADAGERIVAEAADRFGALDVIVNGASTAVWRDLDDVPDDAWTEAWELNVMAPMRLMRAALPAMAERGWGRVVNVASSAGKRPSVPHLEHQCTMIEPSDLAETITQSDGQFEHASLAAAKRIVDGRSRRKLVQRKRGDDCIRGSQGNE